MTSDKNSSKKDIVQLALEHFELWHDADGNAYASERGGNRENYSLNSVAFSNNLSGIAYDAAKLALRREQVDQVILVLSHEVRKGKEYPVGTRVCEYGGKIYLDLCDDSRRVIEVDELGWRFVDNCPVKFIRRAAMSALPEPQGGGSLTKFLDVLNLPDQNARMLFVGFILGAFMPSGPYPLLVLSGEQGSGKTTAAKAIKFIIDPSEKAPLRSRPKDEAQLLLWAQGCLVLALDNLSFMPQWMSDALCRLSTGGGHSVRKLYTDGDEFFLNAQRPVIMTGIEDIANRGDLIDRAIIIQMPQISDASRITEAQVWSMLVEERPRILGALLSAVSASLRHRSTTVLESKPRMADFAIWVTAAERMLGWEKNAFINAYLANRRESFEIGLEASPFFKLLTLGMEQSPEFQGTATELHELLRQHHGRLEDLRTVPKHPSKTSGELRKIAPALRQMDWKVIFTKPKQRLIEIVRPLSAKEQQSIDGSADSSEPSPDALP